MGMAVSWEWSWVSVAVFWEWSTWAWSGVTTLCESNPHRSPAPPTFQRPYHYSYHALEPSSSRLSTSRFAQPRTDKQIQTQQLEGIPKSTLHDTRYCVNLWEQWRTNWCKITGEREHFVSIDSLSDQSLNHWLTRFILEVRKQDGSEYVPNTLHHIMAGLMRYLRWSGKAQIYLFKYATFAKFRSSLDARWKDSKRGKRSEKKQAEI